MDRKIYKVETNNSIYLFYQENMVFTAGDKITISVQLHLIWAVTKELWAFTKVSCI